MKLRSKIFVLAVAICMFGTAAEGRAKSPCTREQVVQAEKETDNLKNWNSVYRFYKQFSQCDDGSIAEGVSEAIAKLLANKWSSFDEFAKLANNDKEFEKFVLRHVDETIDWGHDAPAIRRNALTHCPNDSKGLCKALILRTTPPLAK
jgi:hypothetical protein